MGGGGGAERSEKWGPTEFSLGFLPAWDVDLALPDAVRVGEMSVFRGSISEYPGVIVDHFVPANCERGRFFFLSHCHRGLCVCGSLAHLAAGLPAACCVSLHYCCSCCMHTLCMEYALAI